jgi:hypothetical protein
MDRYLLPSHLITSQAHWDAMADAIGEVRAEQLYGPRPELTNTANSVEHLYLADKAPRRTLWVVCALAAIMAASVLAGAWKGSHADTEVPTVIDDCALVLTRNGQECR